MEDIKGMRLIADYLKTINQEDLVVISDHLSLEEYDYAYEGYYEGADVETLGGLLDTEELGESESDGE